MSSVSPNVAEKLNKIFKLAVENNEFRTKLTEDAKSAIDQEKSKLGFDSSALTPDIISVLDSLTEEELKALSSIKDRLAPIAGVRDQHGSIIF